MVFKDANITTDPNYGFASVAVVYKNGYGVADINITITKLVPADRSFVQYKIYRKMQNNKLLPVIISKKRNLCMASANPKMDPYLYKLTENISRYTNLFKNVPLQLVC